MSSCGNSIRQVCESRRARRSSRTTSFSCFSAGTSSRKRRAPSSMSFCVSDDTGAEGYPSARDTIRAVLGAGRYPGTVVFNKEKREKDKAVKEELKELIKPRPTFDQKREMKARRLDKEKILEDRAAVVANRIRDIHSGDPIDDPDIARFGGDLLYLDGLSQIQV